MEACVGAGLVGALVRALSIVDFLNSGFIGSRAANAYWRSYWNSFRAATTKCVFATPLFVQLLCASPPSPQLSYDEVRHCIGHFLMAELPNSYRSWLRQDHYFWLWQVVWLVIWWLTWLVKLFLLRIRRPKTQTIRRAFFWALFSRYSSCQFYFEGGCAPQNRVGGFRCIMNCGSPSPASRYCCPASNRAFVWSIWSC